MRKLFFPILILLVCAHAWGDKQTTLLYEQAIKLFDESRFDETKLDESIKLLSNLIGIAPDHAHAYRMRANAYSLKGEFDLAKSDFDKALSISPEAIIYSDRSILMHTMGRIDEAIEDANIAIKKSPDTAEAYNNLGYIYFSEHKLEEALQNYNKALAIQPDNAFVLNNRGRVYMILGELEQGLADFERVETLDPYSPMPAYYKGLYYAITVKDDNLAIEQFTKAIELAKKIKGRIFKPAYQRRGEAWRRLGNIEQAEKDRAMYQKGPQ